MEQQQQERHPCACGCGELVSGTWKRGHSVRGRPGDGRRLSALPKPDELDDLPPEEFGPIIDIGEVPPSRGGVGPDYSVGERPPTRQPEPEPEDLADDEPPPHARREWRQQPRTRPKSKTAPARITAGVRGDIDAKIRFALQVPGSIWQARDPLCGGVFVAQIPDTAEAFTDIICDSPDLLAFFSGPGGSFMKALKVGAALMPVISVTMAHHVYHSVEIGEQPEESPSNYQQYAA